VKEVELSEEAEAQVDQIDVWWRANRLASPDLFTNELNQALRDLGAIPSLGTTYRAGTEPLRRFLLRRTHCHLYFVEEPDRLYIVAVWSAFRGTGPKL
jgi:plasmid stabilization system protein ParE